MSKELVLEFKNLVIGYDNELLLNNASQKLYLGEVVALIGRNGCGKSTLLKTISGEMSPLSGSVELFSKNITRISPKELARMVSIVTTVHPDIIGMSVEEVVALGRYPYLNLLGTLTSTDVEVINKALLLLGIDIVRKKNYNQLSDGQKQRVMIARAYVQETPLIILDEPTTYLDYIGREDILTILKQLTNDGKRAIVFSSHDLDLIQKNIETVWAFTKKRGFVVEAPSDVLKGEI